MIRRSRPSRLSLRLASPPALAALLLLACGGKIDTDSSPPTATTVAPGVPTRPPATDPGPDLQPPPRDVTTPLVVDLGKVTYGQDVTLTVPAGALGFNVVVESTDGSTSVVGIERITSPSGEVVHDAYTPKGGSHPTSESSFGTIASASVPQSEARSANTPEPGKWTIRIGGGSTEPPPPPPPLDAGLGDGDGGTGTGTTFHLEARIQLGSSSGFAGGRLDMNVFVPPGLVLGSKKLDAKSAETDEGIESRLNAFYKALEARVGIDRGDVRFFSVSSELRFVDSETALVDAFRASTGRPDAQALNLMLTNSIDLGDGNAAWGIAPGIPGAAARSGTPMSGIVLAVGDTPAVGDGLTILHEGGHFIGLNHTTEFCGRPRRPALRHAEVRGDLARRPGHVPVVSRSHEHHVPCLLWRRRLRRRRERRPACHLPWLAVLQGLQDAVTTKGTMSFGSSFSLASLARPGERTTLTKSGRALTPVETWLSASLCSHARLDARALARAKGRDATIAALHAASIDADLPGVMRQKALSALRSL